MKRADANPRPNPAMQRTSGPSVFPIVDDYNLLLAAKLAPRQRSLILSLVRPHAPLAMDFVLCRSPHVDSVSSRPSSSDDATLRSSGSRRTDWHDVLFR